MPACLPEGQLPGPPRRFQNLMKLNLDWSQFESNFEIRGKAEELIYRNSEKGYKCIINAHEQGLLTPSLSIPHSHAFPVTLEIEVSRYGKADKER